MRVLLSGYTCDPNGGSEAANTWYTAVELARAGAQVHVLTRERDRGLVGARDRDVEGLSLVFLSDVVPGPLGRGQVGVYARYAAFQRRVRRWLSEHPGWDVTHHVSWGSVNHPIGARDSRPLIVGPAGGGQPLQPQLAQWVDGPLRWNRLRNVAVTSMPAANPFTRHLARAADVVLAANAESAQTVSRLGARRVIAMLPEGVRGIPPLPVNKPAAPIVAWVGRFLPIKAGRLAVASFRHVLEFNPEARMVFVGDGPTLPMAQESCRDLVAAGAVEFTGRLPWMEAQEVLRNATVHLFTSVRDSSSAQVLEAATLGVPSVALRLAAIASIWPEEAVVAVEPSPVDSLPQRLGAAVAGVLSTDPDRWLQMSAAAGAFARRQTYAQRAVLLMDLYRTLGAR